MDESFEGRTGILVDLADVNHQNNKATFSRVIVLTWDDGIGGLCEQNQLDTRIAKYYLLDETALAKLASKLYPYISRMIAREISGVLRSQRDTEAHESEGI